MIRNILFSIFFFSGIILISIFFIPSLFLHQKIDILGGNDEFTIYDITSNGYVMRDQFDMDILGYRTIDALIHLFVIVNTFL